MAKRCTDILARLPDIRKETRKLRDIILANLAMIAEIPAPTFGEEHRVRFLQQRFSECGLQNCSTDEGGNALAAIPGEMDNNILAVAHADTPFPDTVDHTMTLRAKTAIGPGVADNSLGLAVLVSLPTVLDHLGIDLKASLFLMGASRSLGRGNLEGLTFFLENNRMPIRAGVCLEGVGLGRLSFASIGMLRGEIRVSVPEEYDWTRFGVTSAILVLNDVINRINEIRLPKRPRSSIVLGSVEGGKSYDTIATQALLRFEIRSESGDMVRQIRRQMGDIATEVSSNTGAKVVVEVFARRQPGGIAFGHPLAGQTRRILRALRIPPRIPPSMSELSAFIDRQIPAITLGVTTGKNIGEPNETVDIEPISAGITQVIGVLLAVDGGYCDED